MSRPKGSKLTEEHKQKIRISSFGRENSEEMKKKISETKKRQHLSPPNKGKKMPPMSLISRIKMSYSRRGSKHWNWKGGKGSEAYRIRNTIEYKLWRMAVFERDHFTCVWCGDNTGHNLEADHIKPFAYFPELRFAIDNGRTLCHECHTKTDTYLNKYKKSL